MIRNGRADVPSTSFIVAKNWDRSGGRLSEIVNGLYIAERFNVPFRFAWPSEALWPEIMDLLQLFSEEFIHRHLIDEAALVDVPETVVVLDGKMSKEAFHSVLYDSESTQAIRISNFFQIPKFLGDSDESQLADFARIAESLWSEEVSGYSRAFDVAYENVCVLHCRFGDLVTGQWRNWVDPPKYITALQIEEVLKANAESGVQTQLVSDSVEIFQLFPGIYTPNDSIFGGPSNLDPESLQLVTDLMSMKSSKEVVGPEASAFSTFGARIGGKHVRKLSRSRINIWEALDQTNRTKMIWSRLAPKNRNAFVSRDIDQYLNSLSGIYDLQVFGEVTNAAFVADPTNVVSINNRAIYFALSGDRVKCESLISLAKEISVGYLKVHHDPLFISLAVEYIAQMFLLLLEAMAKAELTTSYELPQINPQMLDLEPYQLDKTWVIESLERIRIEFNARTSNDVPHLGFHSEILLQVLSGRFFGSLKPVFALNLIQCIGNAISPDALVQERDALVQERDALVQERDALVQERDQILGSRSWRWSKPARTFFAWVRAKGKPLPCVPELDVRG